MPTLRRALLPALLIAAAISVAACGPNGATTAPTTAAPATSAPAASASAGLSGTPPDLAKMQQCLEAAGIALPSGGFGPLPSGFAPPSGGVGPMPSGFAPPSGFTPPSGGFPGGAMDPAVAAALKACGITLPGAPGNP
jgi:hypothetical protein